jgi:bifunctional non-homologous end joining protein LigD
VDVSRVPFIAPALPRLRATPPTGENWLFEVKLDGYRIQLHKSGLAVRIYSKNGADFTRRYPAIGAAVLGLPIKSCIIDGELINGRPNFLALLHGRHVPVCVYAFDLMELQGRDLRDQPLYLRRAHLAALLARSSAELIRFSESFRDANVLMAECARLGLEGIVAKRRDAPYRSGTRSGWIKVKTPEWKAANQYRAKLFEKS